MFSVKKERWNIKKKQGDRHLNTKASIGPSGSSEHKDDLNNLQRSLFFALCIPPGNTHTHKPLLQFPGRIIYADCKVVQLLWCCTEQNSRCVLYNRSRGKEGRVEEDYRQNFPSFLLPACISTFLSLSRQTGSLSVSFFLYPLYFPLSMLSYTSHSLSRSFFPLFWIQGGFGAVSEKM